MVMGRRPGVARSSWPITTTDLMGLAGQLSAAMARVPFRRPWSGEGSLPHNLAVAVTRETLRSFMGYSSSLPIAEWRSIEVVLDDLWPRDPAPTGALGRHRPAAGHGGRRARDLVPPEGRRHPGHHALPPRRGLRGHLASHVRPVHRLAVPPHRM